METLINDYREHGIVYVLKLDFHRPFRKSRIHERRGDR